MSNERTTIEGNAKGVLSPEGRPTPNPCQEGRARTSCVCNPIIDKPTHYTYSKVECIDAIESATIGLDGPSGYCVGNLIKYVWRFSKKNGLEDLHKAKWYLERLIEQQQMQNAKSIGKDYEVNR